MHFPKLFPENFQIPNFSTFSRLVATLCITVIDVFPSHMTSHVSQPNTVAATAAGVAVGAWFNCVS